MVNKFFGEVDHLVFQLHVIQLVDFLHAGGRGYVDFRQIRADDINPDKVESFFLEMRFERLADVQFVQCNLGGLGGSAGHEIIAKIVGAVDPQNRTDRFAVEQKDAFVALLRLGNILLHNNFL